MTRQVRRPEVIDPGFRSPETQPEGFICARVYIPDHQLHIAAFWGILESLTKWLTWERGGTKAKDAAAKWKAAWDLSRAAWEECAGECGIVDIRQKSGEPCTIEKRTDCDTWEDAVDMLLCVPRMRIHDGKIQQDTTGNDDWQDTSDETTDERITGETPPAWETPPADADCLSALNAYEFIMARVNQIAEANASYDDFLTYFSVLVAGLAILSGVGVIVVILAGALLAILDTFAGDWSDVVGLDLTKDILCPLREAYAVAGDGTMTEAEWVDLKAAIEATRTGKPDFEMVALALVIMVIDAVGPVGMSRMANVAGVTSGSCDCVNADWVHHFDFRVGLGDWTIDNFNGQVAGVWHDGIGVRGVYQGSQNLGGAYRVRMRINGVDVTEFIAGAALFVYDPAEAYYSYRRMYIGLGAATMGEFYDEAVTDPPDTMHPDGWRQGEAIDDGDGIYLQTARIHQGDPQPDQGDEGGLVVSRVIVWGSGTDPFL